MKCPKCDGAMQQFHNPYADYEQCTQCKGIWLDMLEDEDLKEVADAIDDGDPALGKAYNDKEDVYCPVCANSKMIKMVNPQQHHIWFEQCSLCKGRFYDAGELKDSTSYTIADFFKDLFTKERKG